MFSFEVFQFKTFQFEALFKKSMVGTKKKPAQTKRKRIIRAKHMIFRRGGKR